MHVCRYGLLLLSVLTIVGCAKKQPVIEEQSTNPQPDARINPPANPQPDVRIDTPARIKSVKKVAARNSIFGLSISRSVGDRTYPLLGSITQIQIKTPNDRMIHNIEDRVQIRKIVAFVDEQRSGWGTPWAGVPVPKIVVNFYDGETFEGHFGVGPNFFEVQREGDFTSKDASADKCQEFLDLIGVDKKMLDN